MGRPPTAKEAIDKEELEKLMRLYPSEQDCADWFNVSTKSIQRYVHDNYGMSFVQFRDKSFVRTRVAIKRAQIDKALKGDNTMLIWCGKQHLGQRDYQNLEHSGKIDTSSADKEELEKLKAKYRELTSP